VGVELSYLDHAIMITRSP